MFLRRRGDLALVMAQLGGELFATRGKVDSYFNRKGCGDELKIEGDVLHCFLPKGHAGPHESVNGGVEWWDGGPPVYNVVERESNVAPVSEAEMLDLTNSFGLVRAEYRSKLIDTARVTRSVEDHIRSGPEREAAALSEWRAKWLKDSVQRIF